MKGATPDGGQGPSYSAPMKKSLITCVPNLLPASPALLGSPIALGEMLYMPQWVNAAVTSYRTTTKLVVPSGAFVQESSGERFSPVAPLMEQMLTLFSTMLLMALIGRAPLLVKFVLVTVNCWPLELALLFWAVRGATRANKTRNNLAKRGHIADLQCRKD